MILINIKFGVIKCQAMINIAFYVQMAEETWLHAIAASMEIIAIFAILIMITLICCLITQDAVFQFQIVTMTMELMQIYKL